MLREQQAVATPGRAVAGVVDRRSRSYIEWAQRGLNKITGSRLVVDGVLGPRARDAIRAFQGQRALPADGVLGPRTEVALIAAGAGQPPGVGATPIGATPARVNMALPPSGPGYQSYKPAAQQYGLPETIRAIQAIGTAWQRAHPQGPRLRIGDLSLQGGGPIRGHVSHQQGVDIDIRPVRGDGQETGVRYQAPEYSRALTQELVDLIHANGILRVRYIFFNDPKVRGVRRWPNHDDHLHVRFYPPGAAPNREVDRETPVLDRRSKAYVQWAQSALNKVNNAGLTVDGSIGPKTQAATRAFQASRGLTADGIVGPNTERALIAAGASSPTGGVTYGPSNGPAYVPTPSTAPTGGAGAQLRSQIAASASAEWERWKRGATKEGDPAIRSVLTGYWKDGVGWLPSGSTWWSDVPWSAAFISWVVKKAGAGSSFKYSANHATYTAWAKQNKLAGNNSPFKAYRVTEVAPQVGDIVCRDRGSGATYDNIREGMFTHCDIVVEVQPGKLTTIGGNLGDSVRTSSVTTDAQGRINQQGYFAVIRVGDGIPGGSSSEIDRLGLAPDVAEAARILKMKSPGVKFTSGRRGIHDQARAMAQNIIKSQNRKWIAATYISAAKLQQWVDEHPEAKSVDAITQGLEGVMNGMSESELLKVSLHLSGRAFDIQPGSAKEEDINSLPGLKKFLKKEGGLVVWHLQF